MRLAAGHQKMENGTRIGAPKIMRPIQNIKRLSKLMSLNQRQIIQIFQTIIDIVTKKKNRLSCVTRRLFDAKDVWDTCSGCIYNDRVNRVQMVCEDFIEDIQTEERYWINLIIIGAMKLSVSM